MEETPDKKNSVQGQDKKDSDTQGQFGTQNIYVKDISFETPNSPQIFMEQGQPKTELEMSIKINKLSEDVYEVILNITVTVKVEEKTAYLIEVHQAGIFTIKDFDDDKLSHMLHVYCPTILFPFARETIFSLVTQGGFQPLWRGGFLLLPVNFEAIYNQQRQNENASESNKESA